MSFQTHLTFFVNLKNIDGVQTTLDPTEWTKNIFKTLMRVPQKKVIQVLESLGGQVNYDHFIFGVNYPFKLEIKSRYIHHIVLQMESVAKLFQLIYFLSGLSLRN